MASPVGDSYAVASGGVIAAGRYSRPAWRRSLSPMSIGAIPASNKLSDLNPDNNPAINPNHPSAAPWTGSLGHTGVISAWCGACYDHATDTLHFPLSGGHGDWAGNEPYKVRIGTDTPRFVMMRNPSGSVGNLGTLNDGLESTGVYFDGRPRAIHSANRPVYVPGLGPMIAMQGLCSFSAGNGTAQPLLINEATGECTRFAANPYGALGSGGHYGGSAYDPVRHCIWFLPSVNGAKMTKYDIASNTWSQVGLGVTSSGNSLCYLPDDDCLLVLCGSLTNDMGIFDCAAGTWTNPGFSGSTIGGVDLATNGYGRVAPTWSASLNAAAIWDNASLTNQVNLLNRPTNPRTDAWPISQLSFSGATPTARASNGTFGRFQYSTRLNGFVLLNGTTQDTYFFALD